MKRNLLWILLVIVLALSLFACDTGIVIDYGGDVVPTTVEDGDGEGAYVRDPASGIGGKTILDGAGGRIGYRISYDGSISGVPFEGDGEPLENGEEIPAPEAGSLTACVYDDHEFPAYWQGLLTSSQEETEGKFAEYYAKYAFKAFYQIQVTVEDVPGAKVKLTEGDKTLSGAVTDAKGVAYVYAPTRQGERKVVVEVPQRDAKPLVLEKEATGNSVTFDRAELGDAQTDAYDHIEIMFVIDTTGSMWDEMDYLKAEITDVIGRIKEQTQATVTLAIMVYRDETDEYLTRYSDFDADIEAQQAFLAEQEAAGGGDFPEAVQSAMREAIDKQWSDKTAKIIVHVADAPAHDADVESWNASVTAAAAKGIRVVSVASSGIDEKTEYFFRSQSLLTGGVYVYLTDDSGIGGSHLEATVEERPQVEPLNDALVRVIKALYEGDHAITRMPEKTEDVPPAEGQD